METSNIRHTDESTVATAEASASGSGGHVNSEHAFLGTNVAGDNVVHQRRRVNPESLAKRLGPDLVRDLDALITPGNTEMPSFAVRKELQERYKIDRRHIYDYFHSRGLRVVKEDKHGNPITAKDLPTPLPNLRPLRQAPIKNPRSHPSYPVAPERKLFKPRGITKAKPGRPKKNPPADPRIIPVACETNCEGSHTPINTNDDVFDECAQPSVDPTPAYVAVNPLLSHVPLLSMVEEDNCAFNSVVNPLDESFSVSRAIGDIAYAYRHKLVFERMQELADYPAKLTLTDDWPISGNEASPCSASDKGLLDVKPLTREERQAIYKTVSDSLGPVHGIQECQGTYRKHMQARTKLYFEGLLSVPRHSQQPAKTPSDRKPALGTDEFRHWLSETRFLRHDGAYASPPLYPNYRNTNAAKPQDVDGVANKQYWQISIPHRIQTLDEMFPAPVDSLHSDVTFVDSPVMHTREFITRTTTHARGVADDCSAGGRLPLSLTSVPSLPILPITSVAETRPAGHAQLHGLSVFPGAQEIKARAPFTEMSDSHPLRSEHVPYVAHSGKHLTLNDTQRRVCKVSTRVLDKIRTRPVTSRDSRRRTPSAAGDI